MATNRQATPLQCSSSRERDRGTRSKQLSRMLTERKRVELVNSKDSTTSIIQSTILALQCGVIACLYKNGWGFGPVRSRASYWLRGQSPGYSILRRDWQPEGPVQSSRAELELSLRVSLEEGCLADGRLSLLSSRGFTEIAPMGLVLMVSEFSLFLLCSLINYIYFPTALLQQLLSIEKIIKEHKVDSIRFCFSLIMLDFQALQAAPLESRPLLLQGFFSKQHSPPLGSEFSDWLKAQLQLEELHDPIYSAYKRNLQQLQQSLASRAAEQKRLYLQSMMNKLVKQAGEKQVKLLKETINQYERVTESKRDQLVRRKEIIQLKEELQKGKPIPEIRAAVIAKQQLRQSAVQQRPTIIKCQPMQIVLTAKDCSEEQIRNKMRQAAYSAQRDRVKERLAEEALLLNQPAQKEQREVLEVQQPIVPVLALRQSSLSKQYNSSSILKSPKEVPRKPIFNSASLGRLVCRDHRSELKAPTLSDLVRDLMVEQKAALQSTHRTSGTKVRLSRVPRNRAYHRLQEVDDLKTLEEGGPVWSIANSFGREQLVYCREGLQVKVNFQSPRDNRLRFMVTLNYTGSAPAARVANEQVICEEYSEARRGGVTTLSCSVRVADCLSGALGMVRVVSGEEQIVFGVPAPRLVHFIAIGPGQWKAVEDQLKQYFELRRRMPNCRPRKQLEEMVRRMEGCCLREGVWGVSWGEGVRDLAQLRLSEEGPTCLARCRFSPQRKGEAESLLRWLQCVLRSRQN